LPASSPDRMMSPPQGTPICLVARPHDVSTARRSLSMCPNLQHEQFADSKLPIHPQLPPGSVSLELPKGLHLPRMGWQPMLTRSKATRTLSAPHIDRESTIRLDQSGERELQRAVCC
jgi:hypothetical protein